ncbi:MAG: hypothetical protein IRZ09_02145 [Variibacter sp.]|mgnify:CR=1 FL=1|nr:hypothetical protein [Variibacter sp.]
MGALATGLLVLTLAGAAVSWAVAAVYGLRILAAVEGPERALRRRLAVAAWPFAATRLQGAADREAAVVNKAIVAFFVCMTLAAITISLATNLNRIMK